MEIEEREVDLEKSRGSLHKGDREVGPSHWDHHSHAIHTHLPFSTTEPVRVLLRCRIRRWLIFGGLDSQEGRDLEVPVTFQAVDPDRRWPMAAKRKSGKQMPAAKPRLLAGGNPQIARGDGDA